MRAPASVKYNRAGFTLIELTIVVIIIGILSAMMVAEMSGTLQDSLLRGASRQLISVFSLASSRAISANRLCRVRFDRASGHYLIEQHAHGDDFVPAKGIPESEGAIDFRIALRVREGTEEEAASPEMELTQPAPPEPERQPDEHSTENAVNFYPDGTSDGREIELRDRDGAGMALRVNRVTSRVQIIELPRP